MFAADKCRVCAYWALVSFTADRCLGLSCLQLIVEIFAVRYLDVFLRRVMTDNIVFSPRRRAFVNKPGQSFRAEEYTDVKGERENFIYL